MSGKARGAGEGRRGGKTREWGRPGEIREAGGDPGNGGSRGGRVSGEVGGGRGVERAQEPRPAAPPPPACLPERPRPGAGVGPQLAPPKAAGPHGDTLTAASPKN